MTRKKILILVMIALAGFASAAGVIRCRGKTGAHSESAHDGITSEAASEHEDHGKHAGNGYQDDETAARQGGDGDRKAHPADQGHDDSGRSAEPDEHSDEQVVRMSEAELKECGIGMARAAPGILDRCIDLPGEIVLNADHQAHIVPRVPGIVRSVYKKLGDGVKAGEVMAVIDSRELADAKAEYLAAIERENLARANFEREERLWRKKISSEQEFMDARQALAEARIVQRSAGQKLLALGISGSHLAGLPEQPDAAYTRYEIVAPFDGTVIQRHITMGEALKEDTDAFMVADLGSVWVDIDVYQKDLAAVREGQAVVIAIGDGIPDVKGVIDYVGPLLGEQTRTALARVELPNPDGLLRPGMFITARVIVSSIDVPVLIPREAIQIIGEETVVFVRNPEGFESRVVAVGRSTETDAGITSGLEPGELYVCNGAFNLKAKLVTGSMDSHAGHGH